MDVVRLAPGTYLPDTLVGGYSSMIWAERYLETGDFQMSTAKVAETKALIPEGSLISLLDSEEVMVVETHEVERDSKGAPTLKITGREFSTFLDDRGDVGVYNTPWKTLKQYKSSETAALLMWNHLVNATGQDPSRAIGTTRDTLTVVPNLVVTDSTTFTEAVKDRWLEQGATYAQVLDVLRTVGLGLRTKRPIQSTGNVMTFDTSATASRGTVSKTSTPNLTQMRVDIFNGIDRSRFQSSVSPVIFHHALGHLERPKYLFSIKDLKNLALVTSSLGNVTVYPGTGTTPPASPPTGLNRRILFVDAGTVDNINVAVQKGLEELAKHNQQVLFDAAITANSPSKYGMDYNLGDDVTLIAEYGLEQTMTVAEYVRTEDQAGDRGYPTLISAT